ncbi:hypothetical protein LSH36_79g02037 [Paralvinella palmiformis]|uniref:Alanine racemase C-terminal domain-containing protein n=1 Tax=Paralvinella palmiformis TaxID=53620 RepID=A0AAD9NCR6_9ANNE|nr:hypothetical protein LSH36_79g02037 [Paralvinella palmiformis]
MISCKLCEDNEIHVDAVLTHFIDSRGDSELNKLQLERFLEITKHLKLSLFGLSEVFISLRSLGIKRHVANCNAILRGFGTDLDFVRPGNCIFGLPPDNSDEFKAFGISPIARMVAYPTLIKRVPKDTNIGYSSSYKTDKEEKIAVFSFGYADGYCRNLSNKGFIIREKTGERCPVVGRVCMDAITVRVPEDTTPSESFTIISADYDPLTSLTGIADMVDVLVLELATHLSTRIPRLYTTREDHWKTSVRGLSPNVY